MRIGSALVWVPDGSGCVNCATKRECIRPAPRGYCSRCYRLARIIEKAEAASVKSGGSGAAASSSMLKAKIKDARQKLRDLRDLEVGVNAVNVSAVQIEGLLISIARASRTKPSWISMGVHGQIRDRLDDSAKKFVYLVLLDIVENLRCRMFRKLDFTWENVGALYPVSPRH